MSRTEWKTGVTVVRNDGREMASLNRAGPGRATAFNFSGIGGHETWLGRVSLEPNGKTGAHHHGRHEVALYVVSGRGQITWGAKLEFAANVGPGDFVYFAPYVPHQELNLDPDHPLAFVVVRSDNERIVEQLDVIPVENPEVVF